MALPFGFTPSAGLTSDAEDPRLIGVAQDITKRKRAEEELKSAMRNAEMRAAEAEEGKRILDTLMEHIPEGITIASAPDVVTVKTSRRGNDLLALGRDSTTGFSMEDWLAKVDHYLPDGVTPARTEDLPLWRAVKRGETVEGMELMLRRPGGDLLPILCNAGPILDKDGKITGGIAAWMDITERKRAEEALRESEARYRALVELSPDAVLVHCDDGIVYCNAAAVRLYGGERPEQLLGRTPLAIVHPDDFESARDRIRSVQEGGTTPVREFRHIRLDGQQVPVEATAAPVSWGGRPAVQVIIRDISDRKRAEEQLRQAQKLESLGLLAGGIAHDFNNLLVGVIGNASLVHDELPPGSPQSELVERIIKTGEQAAHLTRQMLAYSGKGRFMVEPLDLSDLIAEMSGLVQPAISKKIAVHFELERDLPAIEADRGQVQQVFMNLVLNAAEAIGNDAGLISIKTGVQAVSESYSPGNSHGSTPAPGAYVYLEVRDSGCGMDEATRSKVFDPFFSTKFTGRGLGLAAVAGIVRGHNGIIEVASAPGEGSCFKVFLPTTERAAIAARAAAPLSDLRGSGTVLVVDDEQVVREMAKKSLERHGFKALLAENGPAAIDIFKRYPGDLSVVVLDLSMPGMSGEEVLPELRRIRPQVKIIVSSGYAESETMRLFHGQNVAGFIQKPYTSARLAEKVKFAIE